MASCEPNRDIQAQLDEQKRVECLNNVCAGDAIPAHDMHSEFAFKINGQWYIGPREYGGYGGALAFFWPSKTPANQEQATKHAPEFRSSASGVNSNFYDVGVEIFLRAHSRPSTDTSRYQTLLDAQANGRVLKREVMRPGLEVWHLRESGGSSLSVWYVATTLRDSNGQPPVLGCDAGNAILDRCTMAFVWKPGQAVDLRFRASHGPDWPEIYLEVMRVLDLLKVPLPKQMEKQSSVPQKINSAILPSHAEA